MSKAGKRTRRKIRRVKGTIEWRHHSLREFMLAIESLVDGWAEIHREDKEAIASVLNGKDSSLELLHFVVARRARALGRRPH
jgi:hypothetical protein